MCRRRRGNGNGGEGGEEVQQSGRKILAIRWQEKDWESDIGGIETPEIGCDPERESDKLSPEIYKRCTRITYTG